MTTPFWSDNPSPLDLLGFADVTAPVVEAVLREKLDPVTVGIEGDWGSGKTSMLKLLAADLREKDGVVVVETHPWEYDPATDPKATLIAEVLAAIHQEADERKNLSDTARDTFKRLAKRIRVSKVIKLTANSVLSMGLPKIDEMLGLFNEDAETVPDPTLQGFRTEFADLMTELSEIKRVVVLVDDLDRCLPETVVASLEAVKLFLSVPKMAFVIAADRRAVGHSVATKYEPSPQAAELGRQYIEKIVQIPVRVPALGLSESRAYLALLMLSQRFDDDEALLQPYIEHCTTRRAAGEGDVLDGLPPVEGEAKDDLQLAAMLAPVLYERLNGNPRRLKRFLNDYWTRATVAGRRGIELQPNALAKLMVLEELEDAAFTAVLGWLREGALSERLEALEAGEAVTGAGETALKALQSWAKVGPPLAKVNGLDSYLRLAASLRSQVGAEVGLRGDVRDLVEALLSLKKAEVRAAQRDLADKPQDTRIASAEYLVGHITSNPDTQGKVAPSLAKLAEDEEVARAMAPGLADFSADRVEAALVVSLVPEKDAQPVLREIVEKWVESERLDPGVDAVARKALGKPKTSGA